MSGGGLGFSVASAEVSDAIGKMINTTLSCTPPLVQLAGKYSGHPRPVIGLPDAIARVQAFMLELLPGPTLMSRDNLDSMKTDNVASGRFPLPAQWKPTPIEAVAPDYLHPQA